MRQNHRMLADILSVTAIVLSASALGWQVITWRRSGAVVSVTTGTAARTYGDRVGDPHVDITASNKGRSAVTVSSWGLKHPDGRKMAIFQHAPWSASTPHRLGPGESASWYVLTEAVVGSCAEQGIRYQDLIAWVRLGDGREITARRPGIGWK